MTAAAYDEAGLRWIERLNGTCYSARMIYEYRVYDAVPGRISDLHARFRDHTTKIFDRLGMKRIGFFTPEIGGCSDQIVYILAFDDLGHRERAWAAFRADPEWQRVKANTERDGPIVARLTSTILTPTDYSPLR